MTDLNRTWTRDRIVLDRLTDHAKGRNAERGSTRELVCLDPRYLLVPDPMKASVEYARTTFAHTGVSRQPDT